MWNADSQAHLGQGRTRLSFGFCFFVFLFFRLSFDLGECEVPGAILMAGR